MKDLKYQDWNREAQEGYLIALNIKIEQYEDELPAMKDKVLEVRKFLCLTDDERVYLPDLGREIP